MIAVRALDDMRSRGGRERERERERERDAGAYDHTQAQAQAQVQIQQAQVQYSPSSMTIACECLVSLYPIGLFALSVPPFLLVTLPVFVRVLPLLEGWIRRRFH